MKRFFAVAAVVFLLVRPLCDVQAAGSAHPEHEANVHAALDHDADGAAPCCADFEHHSVVKLGEAAAAGGAADGKLGFAAPGFVVMLPARARGDATRHPSHALLIPASFYARSARIRL